MQYELRGTKHFRKWLAGIKDKVTRARILDRIDAMTIGVFGDHKQIGPNLFELRMFFGPAYQIYYTIRGHELIILLVGGDKSSQKRDIAKARDLLNRLEE